MKTKIFEIFINSGLTIKCQSKLKEYINFCLINNTDTVKFKTQKHHILPKSKKLPFYEYSDLNVNKWNLSVLTHENHYIAHSLLCEAIENFIISHAWRQMSNQKSFVQNKPKLIDIKLYSNLIFQYNMMNSKRMKKWCNTVDENGITNIQHNTAKRLVTMKNNIDEQGLNQFNKIAQKSANTMKTTILENGLTIYENNFIKSKKTMKDRDHSKGSKNPNAKQIKIFNHNNIIMFECFGNFKDICKLNNLPSNALKKSYKNGGSKIFNTRNAKVIANKNNNLMFIGWSAIVC